MNTSTGTFARALVMGFELSDNSIFTIPGHETSPTPRQARVLVRLHSHPIGIVDVALEEPDLPGRIRQAAYDQLRVPLSNHLDQDSVAPVTSASDLEDLAAQDACANSPHTYELRSANASSANSQSDGPLVSVVIATLGRDEALFATIRGILSGGYQNLEIVIVDNDPSVSDLPSRLDSQVLDEQFTGKSRVLCVPEPRRGLSRARNTGVWATQGEFVVITDDDVIVDHDWIGHIVRTFASSERIACVTGAIMPAELETPAQGFLEQFGGFHKGFSPQLYDMGENRRPDPLYPFAAGRFGSGANIAFRRSILVGMGGFAEDLGAGTPARGGEDIDILRRIITDGCVLAYEPAALLWHFHRRSYEALRKQMFNYGLGFTATVTKWLLDDRHTAWEVLSRLPRGAMHVLKPGSVKNRNKTAYYPHELTRLELLGMLVGPVGYLRSRMRTARMGQRHRE